VNLTRDGRPLPTELHLPSSRPPWPLVVFAHGWKGHPRKFSKLFARLTASGYAVAAPVFPHSNDESPSVDFIDDVNQPADVSFVLDRLLEDARLDPHRVAFAGLSLGAKTMLAAAFDAERPDIRPRVVVAMCGRLPEFGPIEPRPCPLLVVHGVHDPVVPYADGQRVYERAAPPKALLTVEVRGHSHFVEDEPDTAADDLVRDVTVAFLETTLRDAECPRPTIDPALARLESEGIW